MKNVLLLHTGGTLGMSPSPDAAGRARTLAPSSYGRELVAEVPELAQLARIETRILCNLDSSDVGPDEWSSLADEIAQARARADGIVVVHGTDTMAYTAAALSFALVGLDRPVVLTGSQRPLGVVRTDARKNLVDAVDLATRDVPEVGILFDGRLLRGNRATKGDAWSYAAFSSPGCEPLARLGIDVAIAPHVRRPSLPFEVRRDFDPRVAVVWVTPGLAPSIVDRIVDGGTRGIVLAAFGTGNVPIRARSLAPSVKRAVQAGVDVVVVSQARAGGVDLGRYENGMALADAGALAGGDMILEAAVVKLMHALAQFPSDRAARARYLEADVAGERGDADFHLQD